MGTKQTSLIFKISTYILGITAFILCAMGMSNKIKAVITEEELGTNCGL
jgi:hypothetical protein